MCLCRCDIAERAAHRVGFSVVGIDEVKIQGRIIGGNACADMPVLVCFVILLVDPGIEHIHHRTGLAGGSSKLLCGKGGELRGVGGLVIGDADGVFAWTIVAVCHSAVIDVLADQFAYILGSLHRTKVIAVGYDAVVLAKQAAYRLIAFHTAHVVAVLEQAFSCVHTAGDTADPPVADDPAAVIAVDHCAAVGNVAGDTAYTGCAVSRLANALYGAGVVAVLHGGINRITGNTGNIVYGIDPGIHQADILDGCSVDRTEQAHVFIHIIVEIQTADRVALAVKLAGVLTGVSAANGHPFSECRFVRGGHADVVEHILVDHNIGGQLAVDGAVAAVDLLRKPVELAAVADLVIAVAVGIHRCLHRGAVGAEAVDQRDTAVVVIEIRLAVAALADIAEGTGGAVGRAAAGDALALEPTVADRGTAQSVGAVAIGIVAGQMAGIVELKIADVYLCDIAVCGKFCSGIAAGIVARLSRQLIGVVADGQAVGVVLGGYHLADQDMGGTADGGGAVHGIDRVGTGQTIHNHGAVRDLYGLGVEAKEPALLRGLLRQMDDTAVINAHLLGQAAADTGAGGAQAVYHSALGLADENVGTGDIVIVRGASDIEGHAVDVNATSSGHAVGSAIGGVDIDRALATEADIVGVDSGVDALAACGCAGDGDIGALLSIEGETAIGQTDTVTVAGDIDRAAGVDIQRAAGAVDAVFQRIFCGGAVADIRTVRQVQGGGVYIVASALAGGDSACHVLLHHRYAAHI